MDKSFLKWLKKNGHIKELRTLESQVSKSRMQRLTLQMSNIFELWKQYSKELDKK